MLDPKKRPTRTARLKYMEYFRIESSGLIPFANAPSMAPMIGPTITADTMTAIRAIGPFALL
ncbi:MAG: hypothetical protein AABZ10_14535 [Nitrospirota bacterium]